MPFSHIKVIFTIMVLLFWTACIFHLYTMLMLFPIVSSIAQVFIFVWIILIANLIWWWIVIVFRVLKAKEDTKAKDIFR